MGKDGCERQNREEAENAAEMRITAQQENRLPTDLAKLPFCRLLSQVRDQRKPYLVENTVRIERAFRASNPILRKRARLRDRQ